MTKMTASERVLRRIRRKGPGFVFTAMDFLDIGSRATTDQTLTRLARRRVVRRLSRGLYDLPKTSKKLGVLSPIPSAVADAVARQTGSKIQSSGARAANALGLTDQVPAKLVYLTDGPSRTIEIGNQRIVLRHASKRNLAGLGRTSGTVLQALRYLGKDNVTDATIQKLRSLLSAHDKKLVRRDAVYVSDWMREAAQQIAAA